MNNSNSYGPEIKEVKLEDVTPMTAENRFPPHLCDWAEKNTGADYCALGDALREQLDARRADADELERLRSKVKKQGAIIEDAYSQGFTASVNITPGEDK